ncbi:hypothetical protein BO70DRAFT_428442 [Aspergillus heteromorphus CBS 117.55]|uniref:NWD NACHT-NTPase N-terminal domain-containing protein n=1 Tax=Aspergillus heteromorphus CBS 117.55 TaxID=1448321 RepID=A0A317WHU6_9EURO|nr:uncharacterized protein BO70DRAFT_428442 [Aspergillus heteromorphus CBS 117.55]PWY84842.1 hypothetical protein BO70DRAFT_428442 [Aspergillus heteromorphus CBS 117.55]
MALAAPQVPVLKNENVDYSTSSNAEDDGLGAKVNGPDGTDIPSGHAERPIDRSGTTTDLPDDAKSTLTPTSIHNALWEKAYENLKKDSKTAEYMNEYEDIDSRDFLEESIDDTTSSRQANGRLPGDKRLRSIIEKGLHKVETKKRASERFSNVSNIIQHLKAFVDIPLTNIPQTALPWAVVSSTLEILIQAGELIDTFYARPASWIAHQRACRYRDPIHRHGLSSGTITETPGIYDGMFYRVGTKCCI